MPRYKTVSRWFDKRTGNYVDPPTEVELEMRRAEFLVRAKCLVPLPVEASRTSSGKIEPTQPWPPPPDSPPIDPGAKKTSARKKTTKAGG